MLQHTRKNGAAAGFHAPGRTVRLQALPPSAPRPRPRPRPGPPSPTLRHTLPQRPQTSLLLRTLCASRPAAAAARPLRQHGQPSAFCQGCYIMIRGNIPPPSCKSVAKSNVRRSNMQLTHVPDSVSLDAARGVERRQPERPEGQCPCVIGIRLILPSDSCFAVGATALRPCPLGAPRLPDRPPRIVRAGSPII